MAPVRVERVGVSLRLLLALYAHGLRRSGGHTRHQSLPSRTHAGDAAPHRQPQDKLDAAALSAGQADLQATARRIIVARPHSRYDLPIHAGAHVVRECRAPPTHPHLHPTAQGTRKRDSPQRRACPTTAERTIVLPTAPKPNRPDAAQEHQVPGVGSLQPAARRPSALHSRSGEERRVCRRLLLRQLTDKLTYDIVARLAEEAIHFLYLAVGGKDHNAVASLYPGITID